MPTEFYRSLHYPAYDPPIGELDELAARGWKIEFMLVAPPQSKFAVNGLMVIWSRDAGAGGEPGDNTGTTFGKAAVQG